MASTTVKDESDDPKMFDLNLRILGDVDTVQKKYLYDEQDLELKCAHPCLFPVIENIKAMLLFTDSLKKDVAIRELEEIHKKYPGNINTMENLKAMCREKRYRKKAEDILKKLEMMKKQEQYEFEMARYDLEKAYIQLMDLHAETRKTPIMLIQEASKQLNHEILYSRGPKKSSQENAISSLKSAVSSIHSAQKCLYAVHSNCTVETTRGRELAEKFFERGLEKMEHLSKENKKINSELLIWKHLYAKACNRIGSSPRSTMVTSEKKNYLRKSIGLFHDVIRSLEVSDEGNDERNGEISCLVRSYAYLGHIIIMKDRILVSKNLDPPDCIAETIWKDPWSTFIDGILLSQRMKVEVDRVLLNRLALTLSNAEDKALKRGPSSNRLIEVVKAMTKDFSIGKLQTSSENFKTAEILCQHSLGTWPYPNWFAHSVLMKLYLKIYRLQDDDFKKKEQEKTRTMPDKTLLEMARKSGDEVLKLRSTTDTYLDVAQCLYYQAIDPEAGQNYKKRRITEGQEKFLYEALDYLKQAHDHHDCENHARKYALLGKCLFEIGDKEAGIEYMKNACMMEKSSRDPVYLRDVCVFIAETYQQSQDKNKWKLLFDMWFMIDENMRRYNKRIKYTLWGVANKYPHPVLEMIGNIVGDTSKYGPRTKDIIDMCLETLREHKGLRVKKRANDLSETLPKDLGMLVFSYRPESRLVTVDIPSPRVDSGLSFHNKQYDCYILHCPAAHQWLESCFLPLLQKNDSCKINFLQRRMHDSVRDVISRCFCVLVILDDHFEADIRCKSELQNLHKHCIDNNLKDTIIPIVRNDSGKIPEELNIYQPLDFTKPPYPMEKLSCVLQDLPEE